MKNLHKGLVVPILLVIIGLLVLGGGLYIYLQNKNFNSKEQNTTGTTDQNLFDKKTVKVDSPNGGENLKIGGTYAIKWTSNPVSMISPSVDLNLIDDLGHSVFQIAPSVSLSGTYNWTIPSNVKSGSYKISAYLSGLGEGAGGAIEDYSDNYFSITN